MTIFYTSRELSGRVEKDAQKHANRFRRRTWWATLWLCLGCLGWLSFEAAQGEYRIFEGGEVSTPHRLIENDCAKCHSTWAPLRRLIGFDLGGEMHSVTNQKCEACHPGAVHRATQIPEHEQISCAFCHLEHTGDHDIKRISDTICTTCHQQVEPKHFKPTEAEPRPSFVRSVREFGDPEGHPEFAFRRLATMPAPDEPDDVGPEHKVRQLMELVKDSAKPGWRDKAKIKFNHARHLQVVTNTEGQSKFMILERMNLKQPPFVGMGLDNIQDATQMCAMCHQPDASGRYMQPINFEQHCHQCHKLYIDGDAEAPHEKADVVRGFLTEYFTLQVQKSPERFQIEDPERVIPGRQQRPRLTKLQAQVVTEQVQKSDADLRKLLVQGEANTARQEQGVRSSCAKCHRVEWRDLAGQPVERSAGISWEVAATNIPKRWQPHAVFSHDAHQMMNCAECHGLADAAANSAFPKSNELPQPSVFHSKETGDVLLPGIALCRKCHASVPEQPDASVAARHFGARSGCVECHVYHDHAKDKFLGQRNPLLDGSRAELDAILKSQPNEK